MPARATREGRRKQRATVSRRHLELASLPVVGGDLVASAKGHECDECRDARRGDLCTTKVSVYTPPLDSLSRMFRAMKFEAYAREEKNGRKLFVALLEQLFWKRDMLICV